MKENSRLYGKKVEINSNDVKIFWNSRAKKYTELNPYVAVNCNDKNENYVIKEDTDEKEKILPVLNINRASHVIDIGCGIGRLAEAIIPKCAYYIGTDFSKELIEIAEKRIQFNETYDFLISDFMEVSKNEKVKNKSPYNKVILVQIAMYINDEELEMCFKNLLDILDEKCTIYLSDPIASEERLTLNHFYSQDLANEYSVIYRTEKEYIQLFKPLINVGFVLLKSESFLKEIKQYKETERHYFILER